MQQNSETEIISTQRHKFGRKKYTRDNTRAFTLKKKSLSCMKKYQTKKIKKRRFNEIVIYVI